jgi:hypothetical protein
MFHHFALARDANANVMIRVKFKVCMSTFKVRDNVQRPKKTLLQIKPSQRKKFCVYFDKKYTEQKLTFTLKRLKLW